jgi:hypothetical protein
MNLDRVGCYCVFSDVKRCCFILCYCSTAFICSLYSFSPFVFLILMVEFYNTFADSKKTYVSANLILVSQFGSASW